MKPAPLEVAGQTVMPGERLTVDVSIPNLYTRSSGVMPVHVVRGRRSGPCLVVTAAVHGDEINGVEIIRRLLTYRGIARLRGTLLAVPVVNVYGFIAQSRYLPDRRDLNRSFPGSEGGSLTARLANHLMTTVLTHATHVVDLHTAAVHRENLPQVRACLSNPEAAAMAHAFAASMVIDSAVRDGSLRATADERGIPLVLYEGGEALRFGEFAIRAGVRGVLGVMRHLKMLPASRRRASPKSVVSDSSTWVRAPSSGILRTTCRLGATVDQNDVLGFVSDPFGMTETPVHARAKGVVIGRVNLPLATEGEALFHIARVSDIERAERRVRAQHEALAGADHLGDRGLEPAEDRDI